jgi:glutathione S-transferase
MTITITAFETPPDRGQVPARDMPVRWAPEEAGVAYRVRLVSFAAMKEPAHRRLQPFGQIPTYEEGDLALFESGAIIFHVAERHPGLLPDDADARALTAYNARAEERPAFQRAFAAQLAVFAHGAGRGETGSRR